jgi:hypothetical protein
MSTWKCPKCGAKNPAPIHSRPETTCAACAESFSTQYSIQSPEPTAESKNQTVKLKLTLLMKLGFIFLFILFVGICKNIWVFSTGQD